MFDYNLQDYDAALSFVKLTMEVGKKNRPAPCTPWIVATCSRDKSLGNIWGKVGNAKTRIENHEGSRDPMKTDVLLHPDPYNLQKHIEALSS